MAKEPEEQQAGEDLEQQEGKSGPLASLSVRTKVIAVIVAITLVEAIVFFIISKGCGESDILGQWEQASAKKSGDVLNPTVTMEPQVIPLKQESMADQPHYLKIQIALEIASKEEELKVTEDIEKLKPWIKEMVINQVSSMTFRDISMPEAMKNMKKKLLESVNEKLGRGSLKPRIRSVIILEWFPQ